MFIMKLDSSLREPADFVHTQKELKGLHEIESDRKHRKHLRINKCMHVVAMNF